MGSKMLLAMFLCAAALRGPAAGADVTAPQGWQLTRYSTTACSVEGPRDGDASLSIASFGPQLMLLITANGLAGNPGTYKIALRFDDGPVLDLNAVGYNATYGIALTPAVGTALRAAAQMSAAIDSKVYQFTLRNTADAMDDASHCAGAPTYGEQMANPPRPIAGAGDWKIETPASGAGCSARLNGPDVDTMLLRNNLGKLVLVAGRPDWARPGGDADITLQIDSDPPMAMKAHVFSNLLLVPVDDEQMAHLRTARNLTWHLPWGDFQAQIADLGAAFDALGACSAPRP